MFDEMLESLCVAVLVVGDVGGYFFVLYCWVIKWVMVDVVVGCFDDSERMGVFV